MASCISEDGEGLCWEVYHEKKGMAMEEGGAGGTVLVSDKRWVGGGDIAGYDRRQREWGQG